MFFEWFERSPELPGHWTLVTAAEHQVTANLGSQANLNSFFITLFLLSARIFFVVFN